MASSIFPSNPDPTIEPFTKDLNGIDVSANYRLEHLLWGSLGTVAMVVLVIRTSQLYYRRLRQLSTVGFDRHQGAHWARSRWKLWPILKRHVLYAPLWRKLHNKEIRLSSAGSYGTLPSRLHAIILVLYVLINLAYSSGLCYDRPNHYEILAEVRGRSGSLAVTNMIALVILAGRNNPLIHLLQVSFDTYNLLHRWMGRMVAFEVLIHATAWMVAETASATLDGVTSKLRTQLFLQCGDVPQLPYIQAAAALWLCERFFRLARVFWCNFPRNGKPWTRATLEYLPGEACRVTLRLPKMMDMKPGSHAYLRFGNRLWESHPFSIAWFEHTTADPTLPSNEKPQLAATATEVSFIVQAKTGLTRRIYDKARSSSGIQILAAFEGPYGDHTSLSSYGHCVLFAGSSGITHQLSFLRYLVTANSSQKVCTRRITLIWVTKCLENLSWIQPWLDQILHSPESAILTIKLFCTRTKAVHANATIGFGNGVLRVSHGRPDVRALLDQEVAGQVGAMCVTVCGPGGLADDVREAVRGVQDGRVVDFVEESFTW